MFSEDLSENLTTFEFKALSHLSTNKNIAIQKTDKGNITVILDKTSSISAIREILIDHTKFSNHDIPIGKEINYITNHEARNIYKATYKNNKPAGSKPGILYRLGKVNTETKNGLPPLSSVLYATGTSTYKLAKFLLPFLTPLTEDE